MTSISFINPDDVYSAAGIDSTIVSVSDVEARIPSAEAEAARILGVGFTSDTSVAVAVVDEYYTGDGTDHFVIKNKYVNSITSLAVSQDYGQTWTTITPSNVWFRRPSGVVKLKPIAEATFFYDQEQSIKVSYKYGVVPGDDHKRFMAVLAGIMVLTKQQGGSYQTLASFSLPEMTGATGDVNEHIRKTIETLRAEANFFIEHYPKVMIAL
jgi:hypothetical protein